MWYLDNIYIMCCIYNCNRIGGVMVDRVKSKTMKLVFVVSPLLKHAALKRKSKDRLAQSQANVSEYGDMSIWFLLLQWASTIKIQLSLLV
jgi:hypothetical protein